jgi:hypothetical protein
MDTKTFSIFVKPCNCLFKFGDGAFTDVSMVH